MAYKFMGFRIYEGSQFCGTLQLDDFMFGKWHWNHTPGAPDLCRGNVEGAWNWLGKEAIIKGQGKSFSNQEMLRLSGIVFDGTVKPGDSGKGRHFSHVTQTYVDLDWTCGYAH